MKLPQADRYYLFAFSKRKKIHLLYFEGYDYHLACYPDMGIEMVSRCEGSKEGISREEAAAIDEYYNELTCPTCLKLAQGENQMQGVLV